MIDPNVGHLLVSPPPKYPNVRFYQGEDYKTAWIEAGRPWPPPKPEPETAGEGGEEAEGAEVTAEEPEEEEEYSGAVLE